MLTFADIVSARARLAPFVPVTPLRTYPGLEQVVGAAISVFVKHENHLPTNSFKYRNGLAAMTAPTLDERARGVIATTLGDHGQGVAVAARISRRSCSPSLAVPWRCLSNSPGGASDETQPQDLRRTGRRGAGDAGRGVGRSGVGIVRAS